MRRGTRRVLRTYAILVFLFLYTPMVMLVIFSFNASRVFGRLTGFTLGWYGSLLGRGDIWAAFNNSIVIAVWTAVLSMILGTLAAYAMSRYKIRGSWLIAAFLYIPIIIPEIAEAASIRVFISYLNEEAFRLPFSLTTVIIGHTAFAVSFVYLVVRARLSEYDKSVDEAAQVLGAGPIHTFLRVTLPIAMPGIIAGTLLAFTVSFDDYVKTRFTIGPSQTLPMIVFSEASRGGVTPEISALAALMLFISLALAMGRLFFSGAGYLRRVRRFLFRRS